MKEKIAAALIASTIVFVSMPGTIVAPSVFASPISASPVPLASSYEPRAFIAALPVALAAKAPQKVIGKDGRESLGVKTTAPRVYAVDERSNAKLYGLSEEEQVPLASITKLMTARVFRSRGIAWNKVVTMEKVTADGGVAYFASGDKITVADLWKTMIVGSSNTAAATLAKITGLSDADFVAEMNAAAAGLGMKTTRFVEPTGLDNQNVSTAKDISLLARAEFSDPEVAKTAAIPYFDLVKITGAPKRVVATDKLLGSFLNKAPYRLLGAKTGYITESGYNIVISVTRDGASPVTVVVLGAASNDLRFQEAKSIAYWAFQNYRWPPSQLSVSSSPR
jgi:serine-type D-Ala-D-Ala endopeptidase (penicillin-binding protein 7)